MLGRLRSLVTQNIGGKVLSFFLAALLWYLAAGQEKLEASFIVPVEFINVPDSVALEGNSLEFVHVRLHGSRSAIQNLSPEQIRVSLDLRNIRPGDHILTIDSRSIIIPKGLELASVSPQYLAAKVAARRLVPIHVTLRGRPAEGYEVVRHGAVPGKVYVIGPASKVSIIREVSTLPVSVRGATNSFTARAEMASPDPEVRLMELKPTEVSVTIQGRQQTRVFRSVAVTAADHAAVLDPPLVQVTLRGPFDLLEKLSESDVRAETESPPAGAKSYRARVLVIAPEGFTVGSVVPPAIEVTLP